MTQQTQPKPHLVLDWTFDIPNNKLFIKIGDDLEYIANEGGTLPYTKIHKGVTTSVPPEKWMDEKHWISKHYGELVGYYQPGKWTRKHPVHGWEEKCIDGFGPDGRYIDHMNRRQVVLEGNDMAEIFGGRTCPMFLTPDKGKTIYKRALTRDVNYAEKEHDPTVYWVDWPQACLQQPRTKGAQLSSHAELLEAGAPQEVVDKCLAGEWADAPMPELQKLYIYPKPPTTE